MNKEKRKKIHDLVDQIIDLVDDEQIIFIEDNSLDLKEFKQKLEEYNLIRVEDKISPKVKHLQTLMELLKI